jgi:hypothetical protein
VSNAFRSVFHAAALFAALAMSAAPAHGRGFGYFSSHAQASGNCGGEEVIATYYSAEKAALRERSIIIGMGVVGTIVAVSAVRLARSRARSAACFVDSRSNVASDRIAPSPARSAAFAESLERLVHQIQRRNS